MFRCNMGPQISSDATWVHKSKRKPAIGAATQVLILAVLLLAFNEAFNWDEVGLGYQEHIL